METAFECAVRSGQPLGGRIASRARLLEPGLSLSDCSWLSCVMKLAAHVRWCSRSPPPPSSRAVGSIGSRAAQLRSRVHFRAVGSLDLHALLDVQAAMQRLEDVPEALAARVEDEHGRMQQQAVHVHGGAAGRSALDTRQRWRYALLEE